MSHVKYVQITNIFIEIKDLQNADDNHDDELFESLIKILFLIGCLPECEQLKMLDH